MAPLPTSANNDPNVGGGKAEPSNPGLAQNSDVGGGIVPTVSIVTGPSAEGSNDAPVVDLPAGSGNTLQHGNLTLEIRITDNSAEQFTIEYTVSGLESDYQPPNEPVEPAILLPDGQLLLPIKGEGSGEPGRETVQAEFPPLPAGTQSFQLVLENQWSGNLETWRVPVETQP